MCIRDRRSTFGTPDALRDVARTRALQIHGLFSLVSPLSVVGSLAVSLQPTPHSLPPTTMLAKAAVAAALLPTLAFACHDHLERRAVNAARETVDRSTEQSERLILDPNAECAPYGYEPVNEIVRCLVPPALRCSTPTKLRRTDSPLNPNHLADGILPANLGYGDDAIRVSRLLHL